MRDNSSQEIPENASLSRRRFLAGALAVPATIAAPAVAHSVASSEFLEWERDMWREIRSQQRLLLAAMKEIEDRADRPGPVSVKLTNLPDLVWSDYCNGRDFPYETAREITDYFREIADATRTYAPGNPEFDTWFPSWHQRVSDQFSDLLRLYQENVDQRETWWEATGFDRLEAEFEQLDDRGCDIASLICTHPCESQADMLLKIEFVVEAFNCDSLYADKYIDILRSFLPHLEMRIAARASTASAEEV